MLLSFTKKRDGHNTQPPTPTKKSKQHSFHPVPGTPIQLLTKPAALVFSHQIWLPEIFCLPCWFPDEAIWVSTTPRVCKGAIFPGFASMKQQTLFTLDERNALEEERHRGSESRDAYKAMATSPLFYCNPSPTRRLTSKGDLYLPAEQAALQLELMTSDCTSQQYL
jgi:hypothetical protein